MKKGIELKNKKGSIKNAPLKPGGPQWSDILKLTLAEIQRRSQNVTPVLKQYMNY